MNSLQTISNQKLIEKLHNLVLDERKLLTQILEHLAEVYRRRTHLELGYSSLFTFCVRELGYSESQAQRRVLAMRAIQAMPELESKLESGKLSLAAVSLVQSHVLAIEKIQGEKVSFPEREQLFAAVEDKSKREVEIYLATQAAAGPHLKKKLSSQKETIRPIGAIGEELQFELRLNVSKSLLDKLRRIQNLTSHTGKTEKLAELLDYLSELALEKIDPERIDQRIAGKNSASNAARNATGSANQSAQKNQQKGVSRGLDEMAPLVNGAKGELQSKSDAISMANPSSTESQFIVSPTVSTIAHPKPTFPGKFSRRQHIANSVKREVFRRDCGCCSYVDSVTGRRCGETRYLEIDHQTPVALGGGNSVDNLTLKCSAHNALAAIRVLGSKTMRKYLG